MPNALCTRVPNLKVSPVFPSPRTNPLARASKEKWRPSGDSIAALANEIWVEGVSIRFTPATMARSHSPASRLRCA